MLKKKKEEEKKDEDSVLDLFEDEDTDTEEKSSLLDEKKEEKETKKLAIKSIFKRKASLSDETKAKRKIFNFEWWEYIIILIEIILSIGVILLFVLEFSL